MSRTLRFAVLLALAAAFAGPGTGFAKKPEKHVVKSSLLLESGQPLRVDVQGALESCEAGWDCWLWISEPKGDALYLVEVFADGSWVAWSKEEAEEEEEEEEAEEDAPQTLTGTTGKVVEVTAVPEEECDKISLATEDKEPGEVWSEDASWMDLPVLTAEQRKKCDRANGPAGDFTVEKSTGALEGDGETRALVVPADLLPTGDFEVSSNGYWGALVDGEQIGQASKTGVVRVTR